MGGDDGAESGVRRRGDPARRVGGQDDGVAGTRLQFASVQVDGGGALQAIGPGGTTAVELGRALGVSKQAAGKMVETLERMGYVERTADPSDARRKLVRLTDRGADCLERSALIFERIRDGWAERLGAGRVRELERDLRRMTPADPWRLDAPGWFGTP
ncbi:MAG: MarR family winged helix-turn-helix transcriptional regulator [Actinomadura sp.]